MVANLFGFFSAGKPNIFNEAEKGVDRQSVPVPEIASPKEPKRW
jgi:hypothetical protein